MKIRLYISVLFFVTEMYSAFCLANPRSTSSLKEALSEVRPDTLVLVDLDNTLVRSVDGVGSNRWFRQLTREATALGVNDKLLLKVIKRVFDQLNSRSGSWLIEENTPSLLSELVSAGIRVNALTARDPELITFTLAQMKSLGFQLSQNSDHEVSMLGDKAIASDGVIFSAGPRKGHALALFLDQNRLRPKKIVIVDDSLTNLVDVALEAEKRGIPVQSWQYVPASDSGRDGRQFVNSQTETSSNSPNTTSSADSSFSTHISRSRIRAMACEQLFANEI